MIWRWKLSTERLLSESNLSRCSLKLELSGNLYNSLIHYQIASSVRSETSRHSILIILRTDINVY